MWHRISNPVYLMILAVAWVVVDFLLKRFANMYLVVWGIPVWYVAPVIFVIGLVWLIIKLVKKD